MAVPQLTQAQRAAQLQAANAQARGLIIARSLYRKNQIFQQTIVPANTPTINIAPQNVGFIVGFLVQVTATITPAVNGATLTEFGPANLLSQVVFQDLNNNTRIQTTGWHLHMVQSAKRRWPYGAARTNTGYPVDFGNNWTNNFSAPSPLNGAQTVNFTYWVPLCYSPYDLRGGIYANVVNATMLLQLTPNPTPMVGGGGDATLAVYSGQTGSITSMTVTVYQYYYDQLPIAQNGAPVLPLTDLGTIYELKNTSFTGMASALDFPMPYSNFRDFLSTVAIYDNGGTLNTGGDINYWELQSANFTNIWRLTPQVVALESRELMGDDPPKGTYYFDSRNKPISTVQSGNMQLIVNPNGAPGAGSVMLVGYEAFAQVNTIVGAASLAGAGQ